MSTTILEYFEALERLKNGSSKRLPRGTKITNDSVAMEAGRAKGSIKKSREVFAELIEAIDEAALQQAKPKSDDKSKFEELKKKVEQYRKLYETSLSREVMLIEKIDQLGIELAKYKKVYGQNVRRINPQSRSEAVLDT